MYDLDIISAEYFELNDGAYALVMGPWVENDGLVTFYVSVLKPNKHGFRKMPETTIVPAVNYEDAIDNAKNTAVFKEEDDNDPYRRPNQKKQGRERKEKKKKSGKDWKPNPNKKIKPPKKHTPGRDHRKF